MLEYEFTISKFDECLYFLRGKDGTLHGMVGYHVDDGLMAGDEVFWKVMAQVATRVEFGSHKKKDFKFCGVRFRQKDDFSEIEMDQDEAIDEIELMNFHKIKGRKPDDALTPEEVTALRGRLGSMLYVVGNTRPFEAYIVSHIAGFVTEAKVTHAKALDEAIEWAKNNKQLHLYYSYDSSYNPVLYTYTDSNFKVVRGGGSQMGLLSLIGNPLAKDGSTWVEWLRFNSKRAKRVAHSTLTAETLAAVQGLEQNVGTRLRLREMGFNVEGVILTDCYSLFSGLYSMTTKSSEMLVPDLYELREHLMPWRCALSPHFDGLHCEMWWVPTDQQLADNLTKVITKSIDLMYGVLATGYLKITIYERPRSSQQALKNWVHTTGLGCRKGKVSVEPTETTD